MHLTKAITGFLDALSPAAAARVLTTDMRPGSYVAVLNNNYGPCLVGAATDAYNDESGIKFRDPAVTFDASYSAFRVEEAYDSLCAYIGRRLINDEIRGYLLGTPKEEPHVPSQAEHQPELHALAGVPGCV